MSLRYNIILSTVVIVVLLDSGIYSKPLDSLDKLKASLDDKNGRLWTLFKSRKKISGIETAGAGQALKMAQLEHKMSHPKALKLERFRRSQNDMDHTFDSEKQRTYRETTGTGISESPAKAEIAKQPMVHGIQPTAAKVVPGQGHASANPIQLPDKDNPTIKPITVVEKAPTEKYVQENNQGEGPIPDDLDQGHNQVDNDPGQVIPKKTVKPTEIVHPAVKVTTQKVESETLNRENTNQDEQSNLKTTVIEKPAVKPTSTIAVPDEGNNGLKPEQPNHVSEPSIDKTTKAHRTIQPTVKIPSEGITVSKNTPATKRNEKSSDSGKTTVKPCEGNECIQVHMPIGTNKDALWALGSLTFLLLLLTGAVLYTGLWKKRHGKLKRWHKHDRRDSLSVAALLKKSSKSAGNGYHQNGSRSEAKNLSRIGEEDTTDDEFM
ncbi:uncharacterized protein [Ptychodera flava]|uniref:uncharacterized protein n=1 Tax=Ptychodera flava TaxID=63121 RepID=UPI003969BF9E